MRLFGEGPLEDGDGVRDILGFTGINVPTKLDFVVSKVAVAEKRGNEYLNPIVPDSDVVKVQFV